MITTKKSQKVIDWRNRTKQRIVQAFGNKCGICGYNTCNDAMDLHHIDPNKKEFSFGKIRANPISWTKIVPELRKCILVCANCHREIHAGLVTIPVDVVKFNEEFSDYLKIQEEDRKQNLYNECPICKKLKFQKNKTCSYKCACQLKGKYDWSLYDLKKLYIDNKLSAEKISKIIGCSNGAVRKRLSKPKLI